MISTNRTGQRRYATIGWSELVTPNAARKSGNTTTSATAKPGACNGANREKQRDQVEPDEAALLLFIVDDVERVEDRLHAGIGAPQRDAEPQEKAEGEPAVAFGRDAGDFVAQHVESTGGHDIGGNREMLADGGDIGKQRVGRDPGGNGRKQGDQRIERHAGRERQQAVVEDFAIGANEDVLPAAPGDLLRHVRLTSAAGFDGASIAARSVAPAPAWRAAAAAAGAGYVRSSSKLEGIDHAGCHQDRGGEPGHEIFESGTHGYEVD